MSKDNLFEELGDDDEYQPSGYDGERTYTPDIAIPIWEDAAAYGGETYRLRIQRLNMDGTRSDLGHIAGDASEAALISQWPEAGTYLIMPIDEHNRNLRDQPYRRTIAADHLLLKKKRAEMGHNGTSNAAAGIDPYVVLMTQQMEMMQQRMERMEREHEAKQERVAEREREIEQRALALTVEQNATSAELHQQILAAQQESYSNNQQQLVTSMNATMMQMQQMNDARAENDARQREREREQARQDEERKSREHERVMEREAGRREREIAAIRANQEYQQRMWEEQAKRSEDAARRDREREQEFMQRQLEAVQAQKAPFEVINSVLKPLGHSVADLLPLIAGGGQKSIIETIANTAAEIVKSTVQSGGLPGLVAQAQAQVGEIEEDAEEYIPVQVASGQIAMVPKSALAEVTEAEAAQQMIPPHAEQPTYVDGSSVFGKPGAGPILPPGPPVVVEATATPTPSVPIEIAKPARKAIRMLVGELAGCAQDEWIGKIVTMVSETPESLEYLKIMTVRGALSEAGASSAMTTAIIANMDSPDFQPFTEGIPRG